MQLFLIATRFYNPS